MHTSSARLLLLAFGCLSLAATQTTKEAPSKYSICAVCKCTKTQHGQINQTSVHCSDVNAAYEVARESKDGVWPTAVRSIALNHALLDNIPQLPRQKLHSLSLAHNALENVPDRAFAIFDLEELNLGYNGLHTLREETLQGNERLRVLRMHHNRMNEFDWDTVGHLKELSELYLQDNYLNNLTGSPLELHELKVLNLSGNALVEFPKDTCSGLVSLQELDLGNNKLTTVPECLQSYLSALHYLALDGNLIIKVEGSAFTGLASLNTLSISNMQEMTEVDSGALKGLDGLKEFICTNNGKLQKLDKSLFFMGEEKMQQDWSLDLIDLSSNNFKKIPSDLVPWEMVNFVDLQGNPWDCTCDSQWMLDSLLPTLYNKNSSMLVDVRCASPPHLASRRFVHWFGHEGHKPFCEGRPHPETQVSVLQSGSSQGMLIALAVIAGVALVLLVVGFILQRRYDRQRRDLASKMGRCRRPRNGDVRLTNPKLGI